MKEQEPVLLNGSIRDNLLWHSNSNPINEDILNNLIEILSLNKIDIDMNIDMFSNATNVISGGEKEKIAIIRSLLKDTDVIILDEPTSAIDEKSISNLLNYLNIIKKDKIIIIITHDQKVVDQCDKIVEISNMKI